MDEQEKIEQLNARRIELERKRLMGQDLTPEEEAELAHADQAMNEWEGAQHAPTIAMLQGMIEKARGLRPQGGNDDD